MARLSVTVRLPGHDEPGLCHVALKGFGDVVLVYLGSDVVLDLE